MHGEVRVCMEKSGNAQAVRKANTAPGKAKGPNARQQGSASEGSPSHQREQHQPRKAEPGKGSGSAREKSRRVPGRKVPGSRVESARQGNPRIRQGKQSSPGKGSAVPAKAVTRANGSCS